jgi:uncharacterized protein YfbU (UPF0304 family)
MTETQECILSLPQLAKFHFLNQKFALYEKVQLATERRSLAKVANFVQFHGLYLQVVDTKDEINKRDPATFHSYFRRMQGWRHNNRAYLNHRAANKIDEREGHFQMYKFGDNALKE